MEISKALDYYPAYGKDTDAAKAIFKAFQEDLVGFPPEKIAGAFIEWRRENTEMPLSANILKILNWDPLPKSAESKVFDRKAAATQQKIERYQMLTPEQQKAHDELMAQIRAAANPEAKQSKGPGKLDYSHWDSMPPEAKELAKIKSPRQAGA